MANMANMADMGSLTDLPTSPATVGARELKTRLGTYLRQVSEGATLIVTERGRPVAELRPLSLESGGLSYALASLSSRGLLGGEIRERGPLVEFEPVQNHGAAASEAVIEDRKDRF